MGELPEGHVPLNPLLPDGISVKSTEAERDDLLLRAHEADAIREGQRVKPSPERVAAFEDLMESTQAEDELTQERWRTWRRVSGDPIPDDPRSLDHYRAGTGAFAPPEEPDGDDDDAG